MRFTLAVAATAFAASSAVSAIPTITTKGAKFFTSDGDQFFVKGVAYQLTPSDPLADGNQCALDAALMSKLGANAIRVYHVDPAADHSSCMKTFSDKGIYAFIDLDTFDTQINPVGIMSNFPGCLLFAPLTPTKDAPHWNQTQHDAFARVMDEFQDYDNVAGFFVGNEVLTTGDNSIAAPYVKAAARDMKAYRNAKQYREIPIGYSAADIASLRPNLQNYMACGSDASEALDFFSLNAYEWCGSVTYDVSGYSMLQANSSEYNIPIFFSETGCNSIKPRTFGDQAAIFGSEMGGTWSGAIVYEWIEEANNYGLISYGPTTAATATDAPDGFTRTGTPLPVSPDFDNLSSQWAAVSPSGVSADAYSPSLSPPACPAFTSGLWEVNGNVALPTLGQSYDAALRSSITAGAAATESGSGSGSATALPGSTSTSKSSANANSIGPAGPGQQILGMVVGLVSVMIGFIWWL